MRRNLPELTRREYDLVIVGGGIFAACAAWDAVLRGLSVALLERNDFSSGSSANSFKMVHGGIRYLQHADLPRLRASCFERSALLRVAPHLIQPLPILIPTYGIGRSGKAFLGAGMLVYDLLTPDRNRGIRDPSRRIPGTRFLSRKQVLAEFPELPDDKLTGGAVFYDGQMYNPTRLVLAFLRAAAERGAQLANYVTATGFLYEGDQVLGVRARDASSGDTFDVRGKAVLNAAGGWAEEILSRDEKMRSIQRGAWSRDACFVVRRRFAGPYALAVQGRTRDPDAVISRAARHLFLVPWRDYTLVGVWHLVYEGAADQAVLSDRELEAYIDEINWAYPALELSLDDVTMWNAGLVPFGENERGAEHLSYGKHSRLIDHEKLHGIAGLVSLMGIRYTMARGDAAAAIDLVARKLGRGLERAPTHRTPVYGGKVDDFEALVTAALRDPRAGGRLAQPVVRALAHNHGTDYGSILAIARTETGLDRPIGGSTVLAAEIVHAIRDEMALTLPDLVFRRTDLATGGHPGNAALSRCAELAAAELGWSTTRVSEELEAVNRRFPAHLRPSAPTPAIGVRRG